MPRCLADERGYPEPLVAVAAHGLLGAERRFPGRALDEREWAELLRAACEHRVSGLLLAAIDDGALPASPEQASQARAVHIGNIARVMALEQGLVAVVGTLAAVGIESRVLKGSAVARLDYARPALRSFIDLDVLVHGSEIALAVRVLDACGFTRSLAEPRTGFDSRFDKGVTLLGRDGVELDLHRTFVLGPWGLRVDLGDVWDTGDSFHVGKHELLALSPDNRFMHACYHAALGDWPPRLASLRDVAEMMRTGPDRAADRIDRGIRWGAQAVVAAAVNDSRRLLGIVADDQLTRWAKGYRFGRREEAYLGLHTNPDKTFAAQAAATLRALPKVRDKADYARALLFPEHRYVAGRHASAWSRLAYGVQEVWRGRPRRSPLEVIRR